MANSPEKTPRNCPQCSRSEPEAVFYKKVEICRGCVRVNASTGPKEGLDDKVERHRQEKMLRGELKKIAKSRFAQRDRMRKARKAKENQAKILPKIIEVPVEVDGPTKELAARTLQRRRLIEFVQEFHPKYLPGWVHYDICRKLEQFSKDVAEGKSPRLMILMPPRHGKSQLASKLFPAWHLGHNSSHEIIACSYNVSLALDFSREVRGVLRSSRFATLFPDTKLDPEFQAAEAWKLTSPTGVGAGGYVAAGIGGPINGKGAHVLIVDDPIKNAEEAESVDHLAKIATWFDSTAYTRLAPGGGVLIIQTWWSDLDLAGRLQEEMRADPEADQYEIVKYPAIAIEDEEFRVKGEVLHAARYPLSAIEKIKRKLGGDKGRYWNALYQQNPIPDEGAYFTQSMMRYRNELPPLESCYVYQAWDFAIGEKRQNDWTVGVTIALDFDDVAHLVELRRFRSADQLKIADEILGMYRNYTRVVQIGVEDGQIWRGVKTHLDKRIQEERVYPYIEPLTPYTDKTVRARPLQGRMQQQKVTLPHEAPWLGQFMKEFLRFPAGMHDDMVDAMAWVVHLTLGKAPPHRPSVKNRPMDRSVAEKVRVMGRLGSGNAMAA